VYFLGEGLGGWGGFGGLGGLGEGLGGLGCRNLKDCGWEILGCGNMGWCGCNGPGLGFVKIWAMRYFWKFGKVGEGGLRLRNFEVWGILAVSVRNNVDCDF
jgi:hypothetical protein